MTTSYSRNIVASLLVTSVLFLLSCTPMWTFQFQLDEKFESDQLYGWIIESNIFSGKNVIADLEDITFKNDYIMKLKFRLPNKKKRTTFHDLNIDSIRIIMQNYPDTVFLKKNNYFFSHKSNKEIFKSVTFVPKGVLNPERHTFYSINIPEEVDSLILQFDVILREAEYFSYIKKLFAGVEVNREMDSLRVIENKEPIIVPIELRLHKNVFKY